MKRSIFAKFVLLLILLVSILSLSADADTVTRGGRPVGTLVQNQFTIHQDKYPYATDLHYKVWQKEDYIEVNGWRIKTSHFNRSSSQRGDQPEPYHSDGDNGYHAVDVTAWGAYVPYCTNVTIDVDFWLTGWNTIRLSNVNWTRRNQARWKYHPRHHGKLTVYGTINCNRIGYPLFVGPVRRCKTYRGAVPWWANDYEIIFRADPPGCTNRNEHYKVIVRRFRNGRWYFEDFAEWLVNNNDISVTLPVIADMRGEDPNSAINPTISCVVDIEQWLAAGPPPEPGDPNDPNITYNVVGGYSPNLPGFIVGVGDIIFNPDVNDPNATLDHLFDFNEENYLTAVVTRVGDLTLDANEGMTKAIPDIGWTIGTPQDNNDGNSTHTLTVTNDDPCDRIWLQDIRYFVSEVDYNDLSQLDFNDLNDVNYVDVSDWLDPNELYDVNIVTVGSALGKHIYHKFTIAPDSNGSPATSGTLTSIADHIVVPDCSPSLAGDINEDCRVNFYDVAILASDWLECTLPEGQCP